MYLYHFGGISESSGFFTSISRGCWLCGCFMALEKNSYLKNWTKSQSQVAFLLCGCHLLLLHILVESSCVVFNLDVQSAVVFLFFNFPK